MEQHELEASNQGHRNFVQLFEPHMTGAIGVQVISRFWDAAPGAMSLCSVRMGRGHNHLSDSGLNYLCSCRTH